MMATSDAVFDGDYICGVSTSNVACVHRLMMDQPPPKPLVKRLVQSGMDGFLYETYIVEAELIGKYKL